MYKSIALLAVLVLACTSAGVSGAIYNEQCVTSMHGEEYDLNPLNGAFTKILEVILSEQYALYFKINPCEPISGENGCNANCCVERAAETLLGEKTGVQSKSEWGSGNSWHPPATAPQTQNGQQKAQGVGNSWNACGSRISYQPLPPGVAKHGITQVYTGGVARPPCESSQMEIQFACKEGAGRGQPTTAGQFRQSATGLRCEYKFLWETDVVCPKHLSLGWIFVITFLCVGITYLVGGIVYKKKRLGATGIEAIPNIDFWQQLPSLVWDGAAFFWEFCQEKYKNFNQNRYENMDEGSSCVPDEGP